MEQKKTTNTQSQEIAINEHTKPMVVSASAGSGKTYTMIQRALQILLTKKANINQLLLVTFTEASATEMKQRLYSVLVENRSGVLAKVSGLFARRCFNIDTLAVGTTDDPDVSCITISSSGDERTLEQIEKQLNKKIDVIKIKTFTEAESISRELMLVKVKYNKSNRADILEICDIMKADIVDMSKSQLVIQICDVPERTKVMINMLSSVSIIEVARTGTLALPKCVD